MKKEEIHFTDLNRWLFGQTPPEFMIEVVIRTVLIYLFLLLVVRLLGKRMAGQITLSELAIMLTLGAIVSPVMQLPDRGIVFGITGLFVALCFQRFYTYLGFKSTKAEHITQGQMSLLIKDGIVNLEELEKTQMTKQQLYSMLREKKITNLGSVERAYLEGCGVFNVFEAERTKPGLPILPATDKTILTSQLQIDTNTKACCNCGNVQQIQDEKEECDLCKNVEWSSAYLNIQ